MANIRASQSLNFSACISIAKTSDDEFSPILLDALLAGLGPHPLLEVLPPDLGLLGLDLLDDGLAAQPAAVVLDGDADRLHATSVVLAQALA